MSRRAEGIRGDPDLAKAPARICTCAVAFAAQLVASVATTSTLSACTVDGMSKSLDQADSFLKEPKSFFERGADGLPRVSFAVMQLAVNGPKSGLKALKPIFAKANETERAAIGKGLYAGFYACQQTSFSDAAAISKTIANMGAQDIQSAFLRAKQKAEEDGVPSQPSGPKPVGSDPRRALNALMPNFVDRGALDVADPTALPE